MKLISIYLKPKLSKNYGAQIFFLKYITNTDSVLDIGCSSGELTRLLAGRARQVEAIDNSEKAIKEAKKTAGLKNINYSVAQAEDFIKTCDKRYDVAVLGAVLSFIKNPKDFLLRLKDVAGMVLIRETKFDNEILVLVAKDLGIKKSVWSEFTKQELTSLITDCGYKIIEDFDSYDMFIAARADR